MLLTQRRALGVAEDEYLRRAHLLGADGLGWDRVAPVIGAAGNAIFTWLPLLFAVGIAIGWAKKSDSTTALAAVVGYMVMGGAR